MSFCTQCGASNQRQQAFCVQCGNRVQLSGQSAASAINTPIMARAVEAAPILATVAEGEGGVSPPNSPQLAKQPSWGQLLSNAEMRRRILSAVSKALAMNAGLTALVLIPGIALSAFNAMAGMVWLFAGSFGLMARTYRRPWRLMVLTCLFPALAAGLSWVLQWWMFGNAAPSVTWTLVACASGFLIGVLRAKTHSLYVEQGSIMARRTVMYLAVWALAFIATQVFREIGAAEPLVHGGLLTSAFTSAMLIAVSLTIFARYQSLRTSLMASATEVAR